MAVVVVVVAVCLFLCVTVCCLNVIVCLCVMSNDSGDELNLRHLHHRETQRRCMITRTSKTAGTAPAAPPN